MKTTSHGDSLVQLTRFPHAFPINCYLLREDDGLTLIDTTVFGGTKAIQAAAQALGAPIRRIVLTHAHNDHVGSLDALHAALPEAEVLISARDARFLAGDKSLDPGEPQAKPRGSFKTCTTRPTRLLVPGDRIGSLEVLASPGHTPGQVAFLDSRDGTLIVGDAFQTQGGIAVSGVVRLLFPFVAMATWHKPTALATAEALRERRPERLAVGHGAVLEQPLEAMDAAIAVARRKFGGAAGVA
jgi:glyoxylase-like metal-dependent hydrolase (beta-lactamase superfamily II)